MAAQILMDDDELAALPKEERAEIRADVHSRPADSNYATETGTDSNGGKFSAVRERGVETAVSNEESVQVARSLSKRSTRIADTPHPGDHNAGARVDSSTEMPALLKPRAVASARDEVVPVSPDIPVELHGKTRSQLAKMYADAHRQIGVQGAEVARARRAADDFVRAELAKRAAAAAPAKPAAEVDDVAFFANPTQAVAEAVKAAVDQHPAVRAAKDASERAHVEKVVTAQVGAANTFAEEFPDAAASFADPAFQEWVSKSPIKQRLLVEAHKNFDLASAREVFATWREIKSARQSSDGRRSGQAPSGSKKVYSRRQILSLMENDPERYASMAQELSLAYTEKRIRP